MPAGCPPLSSGDAPRSAAELGVGPLLPWAAWPSVKCVTVPRTWGCCGSPPRRGTHEDFRSLCCHCPRPPVCGLSQPCRASEGAGCAQAMRPAGRGGSPLVRPAWSWRVSKHFRAAGAAPARAWPAGRPSRVDGGSIHPVNWTVKTAVKRTLRRAAPPHPRVSVRLAPAVESRDLMHACRVLLPGPGAVSLAGAHFPHEQPAGGAES